jgi:hypothetical protein
MSFPLTALSPQLSAALLSSLHPHDEAQQKVELVHDPIGPVVGNRIDAVAVNPQPLPPREFSASVRSSLLDAIAINPQPLPPGELNAGMHDRLDPVAINPQPLPPREFNASIRSSLLDAVAVNPQPLPPRWLADSVVAHRFDAVALNPQPLPPKETGAFARGDEYCGLGHVHLPLPHPPVGPGGQKAE